MGFSRQEYWSGLPFSTPRDFPDPGIKPTSLASPALPGRFFTTGPPEKSPFLMGFLKVLKVWQLAFLRASGPRERTRRILSAFYGLVTVHQFCRILFLRHKSVHLAHMQKREWSSSSCREDYKRICGRILKPPHKWKRQEEGSGEITQHKWATKD